MYAFGIILHQLLVVSAPYIGMSQSLEQLKAAVKNGQRPAWGPWEQARGKEAGPDVLAGLKALVEACWAGKAEERSTAQKVHADMVALICKRMG